MADQNSAPFLKKGFVLFYFILSLVVIAALGWDRMNDKPGNAAETKKQLKKLSAKLADIQKENELLSGIIKADERVIVESDYEEALDVYKTLKPESGSKYEEHIDKRISQVEQILREEVKSEHESSRKNLLINKKNQRIDQMKSSLDSVKQQNNIRTDSLKRNITSLKESLSLTKKQLENKERVQVLSFKSSKGGEIHYLGEVKNGKANGGGVGIWPSGSIYRGQWKDNLRHGEGTFKWADDEKYEGEYVEGKREGYGVYHWPSGERYEGNWKNDRRNGEGTLYDKNNNISYEGEWKNDKPVK